MKIKIICVLIGITFGSFKSPSGRLQARGRITLLRVQDFHSNYGPPGEQINVEVMIQLCQPVYTFLLSNGDAFDPAGNRMLDALRCRTTYLLVNDFDLDLS